MIIPVSVAVVLTCLVIFKKKNIAGCTVGHLEWYDKQDLSDNEETILFFIADNLSSIFTITTA